LKRRAAGTQLNVLVRRGIAAAVLAAALMAKAATVTLTWTPPGDDWLCGAPAR
jgi:hypothetical protein